MADAAGLKCAPNSTWSGGYAHNLMCLMQKMMSFFQGTYQLQQAQRGKESSLMPKAADVVGRGTLAPGVASLSLDGWVAEIHPTFWVLSILKSPGALALCDHTPRRKTMGSCSLPCPIITSKLGALLGGVGGGSNQPSRPKKGRGLAQYVAFLA